MAGMLDRAKHEFGHYVSARSLGFRPGDVSAEINGTTGGSASIDTFRSIKSLSEMALFCEDRIKVLYAGVQAEALTGGRVDNEKALDLVADTGRADHLLVQQLANILRNVRYSDLPVEVGAFQMQKDEKRLWNETIALVEANAELICALAKELYDRRAVHGKLAVFNEAELDEHPLLKPTRSPLGSSLPEISTEK